ncbi:MAG: hypothetical protein II110_08745 [Treponema sp.]|nr:hypothetical protein [Treponema sp.]MBQ5569657.1 hypothetical protein [Treponema sp.]
MPNILASEGFLFNRAVFGHQLYSRGRVEYPAPWGGIRVFNPDCNTF